MRKKLLIFSVCALSSLTLLAQETVVQGVNVSNFEATQLDNGANMFIMPLATEIKVLSTEPQSYEMQSTITLPSVSKSESDLDYQNRAERMIKNSIVELKSQALFEFTDQSNASFIVAPIYSIKTVSSKGRQINVVVRVKGYPAVYTKFRNLTAADTTIMQINDRIKNTKNIEAQFTNTQSTVEEKTEVEVIKK